MDIKRLALAIVLILGFMLAMLGALDSCIGQAYAQGGASQAGLAQEQTHSHRSRPKPSPNKLHLTGLGNGGFENGPGDSWVEYSPNGRSLITDSTSLPAGVTPHSGSWAAWLSSAYITQTVTISPGQAILSFWKWIDSGESNCWLDTGGVRVNGTTVTSFPLCSSANTNGWVQSALNLEAYAGQTVQLQIYASLGSTSSSLFIDDVELRPGNYVYLPLVLDDLCSSYRYFDDFSDPTSGWYPGSSENLTHVYLDGEYQIRFEDWDMRYSVTPDLVIPSSNYRVEADMRNAWFSPGTYGLRFGVHWREVSPGDWQMDQTYQVLIDSYHQEYFVNKLAGSNWSTLRNWTSSAAINHFQETNHLRVDRVGTSIRIYINGYAMPAITDASYTSSGRDAGIVAYSYDYRPVDMRFDNFHASICPQ